jgi:RNA polymerase sigma-70 factor (ECF subfamily)
VGSRLPDELLARRAAAGNTEDFEELLSRYRTRVYRLCYRMAGNAEDAEDWAQESFVRAFRQLGHYDPVLPFTPWLLRVVTNTCVNLAKTRARRQSKMELGLSEETKGVAVVADPMQTLLSGEDACRVRTAVGTLPAPLRQAVVLRVLEEISFREVADVLGVPLQTAASRVRRALMQIRQRLEQSAVGVDR